MSLIGKKIEDFKVQAFHDGKFKEISDQVLKGQWSVFFLLSCRFYICMPY